MDTIDTGKPNSVSAIATTLFTTPKKETNMNIGDHLVTPRTGYTHHGIYIGNRQVIHYSGFVNGQARGTISITSVEAFTNGRSVSVQEHLFRRHDRNKSVERARGRLGEDWYNLLLNNCEQFVNWCITGLHDSPQVRAAIKAISVAYELSKAKAKTEREKMRRTEVVQIESIVPVQLIRKELERIVPKTTPPIVQNTDIADLAKLVIPAYVGGTVATTIGTATTTAILATSAAPVVATVAVILGVGYGIKKVFDWW